MLTYGKDMNKKRKILVTGGTGYIGSHTVIELLESGDYEPIIVDSCVRSTPQTIQRIKKITGVEVPHYRVDICDKEAFFSVLKQEKKVEGIIHFAAFKSVPESVEKPLEYYRNNLGSLENVLEATQRFSIPYLIFSSSCSIYGDVENLPVDETTPMGVPFCPYAHTKQIGEDMIRFFVNQHSDLKAILLRYFNPVGAHISGLNGELSPDKPNNLLPIITQNAIGKIEEMVVFGDDYDTRDGSCVRDYLHVTDIASAHVLALGYAAQHHAEPLCETFNLGSGNGITVFEMLQAFEKNTGVSLRYRIGKRRAGDIPAIYSNSEKARRLLNWQCRLGVSEIVESAWKWELELQKESKNH